MKSKLLTDVELQMMNALWKIGEGSVNDVLNAISSKKNLAYTSVSTILRILVKKNVLKIKEKGRGHIYIPKISKKEYGEKSVNTLIKDVFDDTPIALVNCLLESGAITEETIKEISEIININKKRNK